MLRLHAGWLRSIGRCPAGLALWAEVLPTEVEQRPEPSGTNMDALLHPFAADHERLLELFPAPGGSSEDGASDVDPPPGVERWQVVAYLPSIEGGPQPSVGADSTQCGAERPWTVPALCLSADRATALLAGASPLLEQPDVTLGDDLRYWVATARYALGLLQRQRLLPTLERSEGVYQARWLASFTTFAELVELETLARAMPAAAMSLTWRLGWERGAMAHPPAAALRDFLDHAVDGLARRALTSIPDFGATAATTAVGGWLAALSGDPVVRADPAALDVLYRQFQSWVERPAQSGNGTMRLCLRLEPPGRPDSKTLQPSDSSSWTLRYLLQAVDDPSLLLPSMAIWAPSELAALHATGDAGVLQDQLLTGLGVAARLFPPIAASLQSPRPDCCLLSTAEAATFLHEAAPRLRDLGIGVLTPALAANLGLRARLQAAEGKDESAGPRTFSRTALARFDWQVALGDQLLSREEFEALARLKEPLVQVRGQWVELQPDQVEQALAFFAQQAESGEVPLARALGMALAPAAGDTALPVDVETDGWLDSLLGRIAASGRREGVAEPPGFVGALRPYQKVGVAWLAALRDLDLGACLADDMGLGKTIVLLALLLHQCPRELGPTLLVCPTSVVGNWRREAARFAPGLRVLVYHGAGRDKEQLAAAAADHDLVITSYSLLQRDRAVLAAVAWGDVVLDEAQNIKNAGTRTAQAARSLPARWKCALTGTPVENRLTELWSIMQCILPGYLGSAEAFGRRFVAPIERNNDIVAARQLKALVAPFILRRLKTDPSVIADLPDKQEMSVACALTREQATLYEAVVRDGLRQIDAATGLKRRGQILAMLTKLKQVCDHPALFLHDQSALPGRSGKLIRLEEMLEEVDAVDDHALIFTQYAQMGHLLKRRLEEAFGQEVLFLHGGTGAAARDRMVARFQQEAGGPRLFVLSIKAGGTGLNLTRANHVFHFDRWWNPAVENQATDRAFRIGQRRDVQVHTLVCDGTFEELLDDLLTRKRALAESIMGNGESWLTELSMAELRDLFALRSDGEGDGDAMVDDDDVGPEG